MLTVALVMQQLEDTQDNASRALLTRNSQHERTGLDWAQYSLRGNGGSNHL